jgi:tetratricopeptide (TPR) repeat protein
MITGRIVFAVLLLALPGLASGNAVIEHGTTVKLYTRGNAEYQKGNFASAQQCYRQILDAGAEGYAVYFNLGNACFKQKKLGEAIYYWEKALQRAPNNRDTRENLQLANLLIVDRVEAQPDPLPLRALSAAMGILTIGQESWLVFSLFIIANVLFALYRTLKSRHSFRALIASLAVGLLFVFFAISLTWKIYEKDYRKKGIVTEQKVDVRSGPGSDNLVVFTIHEGIKVRILRFANGWTQVSLPNGWNGWIPQNYIRIL